MVHPEVSTGAAPQLSIPDVQMLAALLGNLMPLLLTVQPGQRGMLSQTTVQQFDAILPQGPTLDHQAAVSLVQDMTASSLRGLSAYLERYAGRNPGLEGCIGIVTQAARCFAARDYAQSFGLIWQAYRVVTAVRVSTPDLPPIHAVGDIQQFQPSPSTH